MNHFFCHYRHAKSADLFKAAMDKALGVPNQALGETNAGRLSDVLLDVKINYEQIDDKIKDSIGIKPIAYDGKVDHMKEMIRAWNKEREEKNRY